MDIPNCIFITLENPNPSTSKIIINKGNKIFKRTEGGTIWKGLQISE